MPSVLEKIINFLLVPLVFKFEQLKFEFFEICVNHKFVINFTKKMNIDAPIEKKGPDEPGPMAHVARPAPGAHEPGPMPHGSRFWIEPGLMGWPGLDHCPLFYQCAGWVEGNPATNKSKRSGVESRLCHGAALGTTQIASGII